MSRSRESRIDQLKERVVAAPTSASLHYQLALAYLAEQPLFASLNTDNLDIYKFFHSATRNDAPYRIQGFGKLRTENALREFNLSVALGMASPLQSAKARFFMLLLNQSEANKHWFELTEEKPLLDAKPSDEALPSEEELIEEIVTNLEKSLKPETVTKEDYAWYRDRGNREARAFLRRHYYSTLPEFRNGSSVQKDEIELRIRPTLADLRKLENEIIQDKRRRIRKEMKIARMKAAPEAKRARRRILAEQKEQAAERVRLREQRLREIEQHNQRCMLQADSIDLLERESRGFLLAEKAIADCKKHLRRFPHGLDCLYILGTLYALTGNKSGDLEIEERIEHTILLTESGVLVPESSDEEGLRNDGQQLERMSAQLLESMGFRTISTTKSADGGIDIIAYNDNPIIGGKVIVQCKDWSQPVGEPIIRDLYGLVVAEAANKGIVIAAGGFTASALDFAEGKQMELIDGQRFEALLRQYKLV